MMRLTSLFAGLEVDATVAEGDGVRVSALAGATATRRLDITAATTENRANSDQRLRTGLVTGDPH